MGIWGGGIGRPMGIFKGVFGGLGGVVFVLDVEVDAQRGQLRLAQHHEAWFGADPHLEAGQGWG